MTVCAVLGPNGNVTKLERLQQVRDRGQGGGSWPGAPGISRWGAANIFVLYWQRQAAFKSKSLKFKESFLI